MLVSADTIKPAETYPQAEAHSAPEGRSCGKIRWFPAGQCLVLPNILFIGNIVVKVECERGIWKREACGLLLLNWVGQE